MHRRSPSYVAIFLSTSLFVSVVGGIWIDVQSGFAQMMQSTNYQIEFDSINFAGGQSESNNYLLEDTFGEIASGPSESASYQIRAGYQQMNETYLALSGADSVVLQAIGGVVGGESVGSTSVTVTTDNLAGYELSIRASDSPAMQHLTQPASFLDYSPVGADPDFTLTYGDSEAVFAFSITGVDTAARFLDNGIVCNDDTENDANACWDGLSTSDEVIAERGVSNHPSGTETNIWFQAAIGPDANQLAGSYRATTTVTVVAQ